MKDAVKITVFIVTSCVAATMSIMAVLLRASKSIEDYEIVFDIGSSETP